MYVCLYLSCFVFSFSVFQRFENVGSGITSVCFSYEQDYLLVGTQAGQVVVYAVAKEDK